MSNDINRLYIAHKGVPFLNIVYRTQSYSYYLCLPLYNTAFVSGTFPLYFFEFLRYNEKPKEVNPGEISVATNMFQ